jgi:pyrroline-5-carboxylate reductase
MDAATVLAASGTAFALRYIEPQCKPVFEIGFDWRTCLNRKELLPKCFRRKKVHPEQLIDRVTTTRLYDCRIEQKWKCTVLVRP